MCFAKWVIPLGCLLSQSGGYHRPLYYCRSWTCGGWGGVCRGALDSAPHSVSCPSGWPVTGPTHTGYRWMSLIQYTDRKRKKKDFYSNQRNRLKTILANACFPTSMNMLTSLMVNWRSLRAEAFQGFIPPASKEGICISSHTLDITWTMQNTLKQQQGK